MKKMKRVAALVLTVVLVSTLLLAGCGGKKASGQIIVGSTTTVDADMMDGWSNAAQNGAIKQLIHEGYSTLQWTIDGEYVPNMNILAKDVEAQDNDDGSRTYTITLKKDLKYNNGDPIGAKDYVFRILLTASPLFAEQDGANATSGNRFLGFKEYSEGETNVFKGINLLGEHEFSITVDPSELPYHYEFADYIVNPYPVHIIAPDCEVLDDGDGAYMSEGFTSDLLTETILNPDTGFRYNPQVTAGAYQLESYDPSTHEAILTVNPNFPGTHDNVKPRIERIVFRETVSATQMDEFANGNVNLLSGISEGANIEQGLEIVETGTADYLSFGRNGYGAIFFSNDFGPTEDENVRRAIGWLLDRDEFARIFTKGYGVTMDTYAGYGQAEYQQNKQTLDDILTHYTLDPEKATEELDNGGWVFDAKGDDYDASKGTADDGNIRHRKVDGELEPLVIEWCSSENNEVSDLIASMLPSEATKVGMKINQTTVDFPTLLEHYYRTTVPEADWTYHMFNLASGFATTQPYWYYFSDDPAYLGMYNTARTTDSVLVDTAKVMKEIPLDDEEAWTESWITLVTRYNEIAVSLPLYSNMYHTFYTADLKDFEQTSTYDWYYGIVYASLG